MSNINLTENDALRILENAPHGAEIYVAETTTIKSGVLLEYKEGYYKSELVRIEDTDRNYILGSGYYSRISFYSTKSKQWKIVSNVPRSDGFYIRDIIEHLQNIGKFK